jgi:hypothetical protein
MGASAAMSPCVDRGMIERTITRLIEPGDVAELRVLNSGRGMVSGYFDDPARLAEAAAEWSGCSWASTSHSIPSTPISSLAA